MILWVDGALLLVSCSYIQMGLDWGFWPGCFDSPLHGLSM